MISTPEHKYTKNICSEEDKLQNIFLPNSERLPTRTSKDNTYNKYGVCLVSLCQNTDTIIVNGRVGKDKNVEEFTSKERSVVDYIIISQDMFHYVEDFKVIEMANLLSDIHRPVRLL